MEGGGDVVVAVEGEEEGIVRALIETTSATAVETASPAETTLATAAVIASLAEDAATADTRLTTVGAESPADGPALKALVAEADDPVMDPKDSGMDPEDPAMDPAMGLEEPVMNPAPDPTIEPATEARRRLSAAAEGGGGGGATGAKAPDKDARRARGAAA